MGCRPRSPSSGRLRHRGRYCPPRRGRRVRRPNPRCQRCRRSLNRPCWNCRHSPHRLRASNRQLGSLRCQRSRRLVRRRWRWFPRPTNHRCRCSRIQRLWIGHRWQAGHQLQAGHRLWAGHRLSAGHQLWAGRRLAPDHRLRAGHRLRVGHQRSWHWIHRYTHLSGTGTLPQSGSMRNTDEKGETLSCASL